MTGKRAFGDFQTPLDFADYVCKLLKERYKIKPDVVLEPTCGIGNFLQSSLRFQAKAYLGIEINPDYCKISQEKITDSRLQIINEDFFQFDLRKIQADNTLIIGNPPWVNNSTLAALKSNNVPKKNNFKGIKGINAITGESNFDICEYIILQLIYAFHNTNSLLAMLCKTSVARNIFQELKRQYINAYSYDVFEFDAKKIFDISASACLMVIRFEKDSKLSDVCNVYDLDDLEHLKYTFGYRNQQFYSNLKTYIDNFEGESCFEWRQGVKHDCSKIMELSCINGKFINGFKETVDIEDDLVFPLVKSSMFKRPVLKEFSKFVIVTQKKIKQETAYIKMSFPLTWKYLYRYKDKFENRKSSIYKGAPPFSMFGIGDYSYSRYKVGISGFYKEPLFSILYSSTGKPVMTDDTAYFICLPTYDTAYVAMLYLNSQQVIEFLKSIAFLDAKRPYTKKVLARLDFQKIVAQISFAELKKTESRLCLPAYLKASMIDDFKLLPEMQYRGLF